MTIDAPRPAPERDPHLARMKIRSSRDGERVRAATRRRFEEAALAAAVRELRTHRRQAIRR